MGKKKNKPNKKRWKDIPEWVGKIGWILIGAIAEQLVQLLFKSLS